MAVWERPLSAPAREDALGATRRPDAVQGSPLGYRTHRAAVDSYIARALAIAVVGMAVQALGAVVDQTPRVALWWNVGIGLPLTLAAAWVIAMAVRGRVSRCASALFAGASALGLLLWPLACPPIGPGPPWLWNLLGVSVACAVVAWRFRSAVVYTLGLTVLFGVVRSLPSGGSGSLSYVLRDGAVLATAGLVLVAAIEAVRLGAERADLSAAAAAAAHQTSAVARARLVERNRLGAIMHDWVLTALVSAARARTPDERRSAATLAAGALRRIEDDRLDHPARSVPLAQVPDMIASVGAADELLPVDLTIGLPRHLDGEVSAQAAEALLAAVYAALSNASRHSGAERVAVRVGLGVGVADLRVDVADEGRGFDPAAVPSRCLGIRLSIVQRMRDVDGSAVIESAPGLGSRVVLSCPVDGRSAADRSRP